MRPDWSMLNQLHNYWNKQHYSQNVWRVSMRWLDHLQTRMLWVGRQQTLIKNTWNWLQKKLLKHLIRPGIVRNAETNYTIVNRTARHWERRVMLVAPNFFSHVYGLRPATRKFYNEITRRIHDDQKSRQETDDERISDDSNYKIGYIRAMDSATKVMLSTVVNGQKNWHVIRFWCGTFRDQWKNWKPIGSPPVSKTKNWLHIRMLKSRH